MLVLAVLASLFLHAKVPREVSEVIAALLLAFRKEGTAPSLLDALGVEHFELCAPTSLVSGWDGRIIFGCDVSGGSYGCGVILVSVVVTLARACITLRLPPTPPMLQAPSNAFLLVENHQVGVEQVMENILLEQLLKALVEGRVQEDVREREALGELLLGALSNEEGESLSMKLIVDGAPILTRDGNGDTPLLLAVKRGFEKVALELLKRGAYREGTLSATGESALVMALDRSLLKLAWKLLQCGASPNEGSVAPNQTSAPTSAPMVPALHLAIMAGHEAIARELIRLGADVNAKDSFGNTPLIWSCRNGMTLVSHALLAKGADGTASCSNVTALAELWDRAWKVRRAQCPTSNAPMRLLTGDRKLAQLLTIQGGTYVVRFCLFVCISSLNTGLFSVLPYWTPHPLLLSHICRYATSRRPTCESEYALITPRVRGLQYAGPRRKRGALLFVACRANAAMTLCGQGVA